MNREEISTTEPSTTWACLTPIFHIKIYTRLKWSHHWKRAQILPQFDRRIWLCCQALTHRIIGTLPQTICTCENSLLRSKQKQVLQNTISSTWRNLSIGRNQNYSVPHLAYNRRKRTIPSVRNRISSRRKSNNHILRNQVNLDRFYPNSLISASHLLRKRHLRECNQGNGSDLLYSIALTSEHRNIRLAIPT